MTLGFLAKCDYVVFGYLLSQIRLTSKVCALLSRLKFSAIFLDHFVLKPFAGLHAKFYGDPGKPSVRDQMQEGYPNIPMLDLTKAISWKRRKIRPHVQLMTNRKSYT